MAFNSSSASESELVRQLQQLTEAAKLAAAKAYAPYSKFTVGCALLSKSGKLYAGCNIENASYSVTLCAERVAASQAILNGDSDWDLLVVVSPQRVTMCGVCRQFLHEFSPGLRVWNGYLDRHDLENLDNETSAMETRGLVGPILLSDLLPTAMVLDIETSHRH